MILIIKKSTSARNLSAQSSSERRPETSNLICACYPKNFISARWFSLTGPALGCKSVWGAPAWIKWKKNIDRRYFSQRDSKKKAVIEQNIWNWNKSTNKNKQLMWTNFGSTCSFPELLTELYLLCKSYPETASDQFVSHILFQKCDPESSPQRHDIFTKTHHGLAFVQK
jgi:hypothetical protein